MQKFLLVSLQQSLHQRCKKIHNISKIIQHTLLWYAGLHTDCYIHGTKYATL